MFFFFKPTHRKFLLNSKDNTHCERKILNVLEIQVKMSHAIWFVFYKKNKKTKSKLFFEKTIFSKTFDFSLFCRKDTT